MAEPFIVTRDGVNYVADDESLRDVSDREQFGYPQGGPELDPENVNAGLPWNMAGTIPEGMTPEQAQAALSGQAPVQPDPNAGMGDSSGLVYQPGVRGGRRETGGTVSVDRGVADDPRYAQRRADSLTESLGTNRAQTDFDMARHQRDAERSRNEAARLNWESQQLESEVADAEAQADRSLGELNGHIDSMAQDWRRGNSSPDLFDGGSGTGFYMGLLGVALAGAEGGQSQQQAINMMDKAIDRTIKSQDKMENSLLRRLEDRYQNRDLARDAYKLTMNKYMQTLNNMYASQDASAQTLINYQKMDTGLRDQAAALEDRIRRMSADKVRETKNYKNVQGRAGGMRPKTAMEMSRELDMEMKRTKLAQEQLKLKKASGEFTSEDAAIEEGLALLPKYKVQADKLKRIDDAINAEEELARSSDVGIDPVTGAPDWMSATGSTKGFGLHPNVTTKIPGGSLFTSSEELSAVDAQKRWVDSVSDSEAKSGSASNKDKIDRRNLVLGGSFAAHRAENMARESQQLRNRRAEIVALIPPKVRAAIEYSRKQSAHSSSGGFSTLRDEE